MNKEYITLIEFAHSLMLSRTTIDRWRKESMPYIELEIVFAFRNRSV